MENRLEALAEFDPDRQTPAMPDRAEMLRIQIPGSARGGCEPDPERALEDRGHHLGQGLCGECVHLDVGELG